MAAAELETAITSEPDNLEALEWKAAVEFLRWGDAPGAAAFRKVNELLQVAVELDPDDADRHYWIAATNRMFASEDHGLNASEHLATLDSGIDEAERAIEIDPLYSDAIAFLGHLYRSKAEHVSDSAQVEALGRLAETTYQNSLRVVSIRGPRLSRPDDQFSRPAPPPPPEWAAD